mgnify:FL=1
MFFSIDRQLYTPDVSQSGVNGIMRQALLQRYPETIIKPVSLADVAKAQAMLICNCVMGVLPVNTFNGKALNIGPVQSVCETMKQEVNHHE